MEAIVFSATIARATQIRSAEDLDDEFVAEPLVVSSPRVFAKLAEAAGLTSSAGLEPLRDATCQSFPIWSMVPALAELIGGLGEVEDLVDRWRAALGDDAMDADPYELSTWLVEVQAASKESEGVDQQLFILFEEKAMT